MNFALTETQIALQESFAQYLAKSCTSEVVRGSELTGYDDALWTTMQGMGVTTMSIDTAVGGEGADLVDLVLVGEQVGRYLAPIPFVEASVCGRILSRCANGGSRWIKRILDDGSLVTISRWPLSSGSVAMLSAGVLAEGVIGMRGTELIVGEVQTTARRTLVPNLGSSPISDVDFDDVSLLADSPESHQHFSRALDDWKVLLASVLVGLADRANEIAVDYVKERKAFGVPVGSFQSVAHHLADDITSIDGARWLCYKAAWTADQGLPRASILASMAYSFAVECARQSASNGLHFHGGHGYTWEQDIQMYFRRATAWPLALGDYRAEYQTVAGRLLDEK